MLLRPHPGIPSASFSAAVHRRLQRRWQKSGLRRVHQRRARSGEKEDGELGRGSYVREAADKGELGRGVHVNAAS